MDSKKVEGAEPTLNNEISKVLEKGATENKPANQDLLLAIGTGLGAGLLGGVIWFAIAFLFKIELGYIAILVGVMVGTAMKMFLKSKNSLMYGLMAVAFTICGIVFGKYLIWYFAMPGFTRQELISSGEYTESMVNAVLTDEVMRTEYTFDQYLKDDIIPSDDQEGGTQANNFIFILVYGFAMYYAFVSVYQRKKGAQI